MALTDSLISYWNLDQSSGTRNDSHGSNHLSDNNTVTSAAGKVGNAGDFELSNSEWLSVASNASLQVSAGTSFTFTAWCKLESLTGPFQVILAKDNVNTSREYNLVLDVAASRFECQLFPDGLTSGQKVVSANALGAVSTDVWYFLVCWFDGVNVNIQVNNGGVDSLASTATFVGSSQFAIGATDSSVNRLSFDGLIDEVGFWKRVLTSDERTQLYNGGAGLAYPFTGGGAVPIGAYAAASQHFIGVL